MTLSLFVVDALPSAEQVVLAGPEGRHAATVRRLRVGEQLLLGDGRGALARCEVVGVEPHRLALRVCARATVAPPRLRVTVAQALVKGERGELAVELATEAGADAILPWRAARCVVRWDEGARGERALARWRSTAVQAAKQARRPWVPEVDDPCGTAGLLARVRSAAGAVVLCEAAVPTLADLVLPTSGEMLLVVGPEGGVTEPERADMAAAGAVAVRLGPEVLRTSTAAAVALGAIGVLSGRWKPALVSDLWRPDPEGSYAS